MVFSMASCGKDVPITPDEEPKEEIIFEKPENHTEETLPEKTKPQKKEPIPPEEIIPEEEPEEIPRRVPAEDEEPTAEDITGVNLMGPDGGSLSEKQLEIIIGFLEPEKWVPAKDYEPSERCFAGTVFDVSNGGFIAVNFYEDKTLILKKWGKNQEHRAYYYAPQKAAELASLFAEKAEEAENTYDRWEDVTKNYPEYDRMLSYFGSGLSEKYDEENYISDIRLIMLFDHAFENEKAAGRIGTDERYPNYPAEFVEELLGKYYLFSAEEIRALSGKYGYDAENDTYNMEGEYGGAYPIPRVTAVMDNGETIDLYVNLHSAADDYRLEQSSVLTIKKEADGSWKYLSNLIYFVRNYG